MGKDFLGMTPINEGFEIAILFATLLCLVLIVKRKLLGTKVGITKFDDQIKINFYNSKHYCPKKLPHRFS